MKGKESILILLNIRSAQNVGSLFRTADAAGILKIYLVGYTPDPVDRFNRPRADVAKAALGAEKTVPWEHIATILPLLKKLKKKGVQTIAIEQSESSVDYKKIKPQFPAAFILGNEVEGIPVNVLKNVDSVAEIPMAGEKESLNVSVAGGIALFRMLNR
jgi:23S rRNA (guanosine2251-2'-O)-methyltransferase